MRSATPVLALAAWIGLTGHVHLSAQPSDARQLHFDAATLKLDNGPIVMGVTGQMKGGPGSDDPGRLVITQRTLKTLLIGAYNLPGTDRLYGPAWIDDPGQRYTINATMPPATTKEQFQQMMQNLLAERLHVVLHHETKEFPGYDLIVGPGGLKMHEWTPSDPGAPPIKGGLDPQGFRILTGNTGYVTAGPGTANVAGTVHVSNRNTMSEFAKHVGNLINYSTAMPGGIETPQVSDKTGLSGVYDFKFAFTGTAVLPGAPPPNSPQTGAAPDAGGQNLFKALESATGLRLVKAKSVPIDVIVIDRADKVPTDN